ncbi:MAG: hypothetical protein IKC32_05980 [Clostridia bacterium]|nr:hypothetical protein [Clostridia bacterium]
MYKKQMTLQRITCYLLLIVAALIFVYSLGIITDLYDTLRVFSEDPEHPLIEGAEVYMEMQEFNKLFTLFGVLLILSALANMVFGAASRRRYYLSNYITIVLNAVGNVAVSVWAIINIYSYRAQYLEVDFASLEVLAPLYGIEAYQSTFWFDVCPVVFVPVILVSLLSIANLVWKHLLMKGERALLEGSVEVEK